jgi:DNA-binding beta-propeller fold protein YncE
MRNVLARPRAVAVIILPLLLLGILQLAAPAQAAVTGSLVQQAKCFDNETAGCLEVSDVSGPYGVAASPDGKNLYVTEYSGAVVSWFARSINGALTHGPGSCIGSTPSCPDGHGIVNPTEVVVSPDGNNVYAITAFETGGVLTFKRNANGSLTQLAAGNGCIVGADGADCATETRLEGARRLAFSPSGRQLYVVTTERRIVTLNRDRTTGLLSYAACLGANAEGSFCPQVYALGGLVDIAVSADGKSLYSVSEDESGGNVGEFSRSSEGLAFEACIGSEVAGCTSSAYGLTGVFDIVVSPDGTSVYTGGSQESGGIVAVFRRSTTATSLGALTQASGTGKCIGNDSSGGQCTDAHGLGGVSRMAIAPDNRSLYVTTQGFIQSIVTLTRATSGSLTQPTGNAGCISDDGTGGCADGNALDGAFGVTVTADGNNVYVAAVSHGGVSGFKRISPPQTTITRGPSGETVDRTPTYRFTSSEANSTFQCKVDKGVWKSCTSPRTLAKQSYGKHVFKVRARDAVGTFDPTPAKRRFKVVR